MILKTWTPAVAAWMDSGDDAGLLADLRTALAVAGILPREPSLNHYHQRADELISAVPQPTRLVVRRYVRWAVTRSLQVHVDAGATITEGLVRWPLQRARIAAQFAIALGENGLTLAEVTQSHLDAWLVELPSHRPALRAFVQWAAGHRYLGAELEVPAAASRESVPPWTTSNGCNWPGSCYVNATTTRPRGWRACWSCCSASSSPGYA